MKMKFLCAIVLSAAFVGAAAAQQPQRTAILVPHDGYKEIQVTEPDGRKTNIHVSQGESVEAKFKGYLVDRDKPTTAAMQTQAKPATDGHLMAPSNAAATGIPNNAPVTSPTKPAQPILPATTPAPIRNAEPQQK